MREYSKAFAALVATALVLVSHVAKAEEPYMMGVRNYTRVKILESNNVTLRPGSVYENLTQFDSLFNIKRPDFNYEFLDSGLGTAEPIYPLYQSGYQWSWEQLAPAFINKNQRHIDHFTSLTTPEGCKVDGLYGLRNINEYPATMFQTERAQGFVEVVVRLETYTRLKPDAQCGRHEAHDPDPKFDPQAFLIKYHNAMTLADFPQADLPRFEWKLSVLHHYSEVLSRTKFAHFDESKLATNSLWYYPQGQTLDFGLNQTRAIPEMASFKLPRQMLVQATPEIQKLLPLSSLLKGAEFAKILDFLNGQPVPGYDASSEPGNDVFRLSDVTNNNMYTSGLYIERIQNVVADVSDINHYALVAMTIRPFEPQEEVQSAQAPIIPQIRFVYQLMDPRKPGRAFEQLFYHLKFDVVDRYADKATRDVQHRYFLKRVDELTRSQDERDPTYNSKLQAFVQEFTARPVQSVSWSSSLTGIWEFGSLYRAGGPDLQPLRIIRDGVDVGYYSSDYDSDLFRNAVKDAPTPARAAELNAHMDDLLPHSYRDPRRMDTSKITFNRVTCAQCHQTSARDGVHMSLNDGIDRRYTEIVKPSEYFMHEADRQMKVGESYF